jgi:DNA polymerase-3 subunit epsilon
MARKIVVVDVESSSLKPDATILEVAAVELDSDQELRFVPFVPMSTIANADPDALRVNRYFERGVRAFMLEDVAATKNAYDWLKEMLDGNVLAGSNPTFDAGLLQRALGATPWNHRLLDLSAYAAGVLGLPLGELPGLAKVCELLGVENEDPHSALGDARATAECFRRLRAERSVMA